MRIFSEIGSYFLLMYRVFSRPEKSRIYWRQILLEIEKLGINSLAIVAIISVFMGGIITLQLTYNMSNPLMPSYLIGLGNRDTLILEFSCTVLSLMMAGKVGSNIASEIGSMRVTEQIDALTMLSTNPIKYLVLPRVIAGVTMLPLLVLIADIIGIFGGYLVSTLKLGFSPGVYLTQTFKHLKTIDVVSGLIKAGVFGFIISLMGCYMGFYAKRGAQGVGSATTNAVVSASILILIANYLLTSLLFDT